MFTQAKEKLKLLPKWPTIFLVVAITMIPFGFWYSENNVPVRIYYYSACQGEVARNSTSFIHPKTVTKTSVFTITFNNLSWSKNYSIMEFYKDREKDNWFQLPKFEWMDPYTGFFHVVDMKTGFVGVIMFRLDEGDWVPIIGVYVVR